MKTLFVNRLAEWLEKNSDWLFMVAVSVGALALTLIFLGYAPLQTHWSR